VPPQAPESEQIFRPRPSQLSGRVKPDGHKVPIAARAAQAIEDRMSLALDSIITPLLFVDTICYIHRDYWIDSLRFFERK
jgi:DeoR/GlpR family transcriptional regulator of sugar metabolism